MCLIVWKEGKDAVFTNRQFKNMINRNADGLGIMWRENGRVMVEKSVGSAQEKFKLFQKHRDKEYYAMHARLRTHGAIDEANCHPYELLNIDKGDPIDLYMMHNGVLGAAPTTMPNMSDTWNFVEYILKPIVKNNVDLLWDSTEFQTWLEKAIGGSKFIFMRSDEPAGEGNAPVLILNANAGTYTTKCWLSNTHCSVSSYKTGSYCGVQHNNQNFTHGQTQATGTHTTTAGTTQGTTSPKPNVPAGSPWALFLEKKRTKDTPLALPNISTNKVVQIEDHRTPLDESTAVVQDAAGLLQIAVTLRGMSIHAVKEFVRDDPDTAADIILTYYEKNTMPWEVIIQQIQDDNTVDGIVDLIRHIVNKALVPVNIKNKITVA